MMSGAAQPARAPLLRLLPHHHADLVRSGLTDATIATWGAYSVEADQKGVLAQLGFPHIEPPALTLPVIPPDRTQPNLNEVVVKPDKPRRDKRGHACKYEARPRSRNRIHIPLSIRENFADPSVPLIVTEGLKKAEAAAQAGLCAIALAGVWNWRDRVGTASFPIGDFELIPSLRGRKVVLAFDSDAASNPQVRRAERDLAAFLARKFAARVFVRRLPPGPAEEKVGLDDFLLKHSADEFWRLAEETVPVEPDWSQLLEELTPDSPKEDRNVVLDHIAAEVDPAERGRLLKLLSQRCRIPLEDVRAAIRARAAKRPAPAPPTERVSADQARVLLSDLLFQIAGFLGSPMAISPTQSCVLALWVFHTHALQASAPEPTFDRTPYLHVSSPEKRCGKTLLLELLALLVRAPWFTSNATTAALARKVADQKPTVLLDEADTMLAGEGERVETLRGILNAGYARGGKFTRCVGDGSNQVPTDFEVFSPKAIAGLRHLPDTLSDRSIPMRLKRAVPGEIRGRFDRRTMEPIAEVLRARMEACATALIPALRDARPSRIPQLNDRENDITEPLLAIAGLAGGGWPERLHKCLLEVFGTNHHSEESAPVCLLADLREIFSERDVEMIPSTELVEALRSRLDSPWADWRGKGLTEHTLARMLRHFSIAPRKWREGLRTVRGYSRVDFADTWFRYLASPSPQGGESATTATGPEIN